MQSPTIELLVAQFVKGLPPLILEKAPSIPTFFPLFATPVLLPCKPWNESQPELPM